MFSYARWHEREDEREKGREEEKSRERGKRRKRRGEREREREKKIPTFGDVDNAARDGEDSRSPPSMIIICRGS